MSDDVTQHTVELIDKVTSPAKAATDALHDVEKAAGGISAKMVFAAGVLFEAGKELMHVGVELAEEAAKALANIGEEVGEMVVKGFEYAAMASDERNATLAALTSITGGASEAAETLDRLEEMAKRTSVGKETVIDWGTRLLRGGFKQADLGNLVGALSDITAMNGGNAGAADAIVNRLIRMQVTGKVDNRAVAMLQQSGVDVQKVYEKIAASHHVTIDAAKKMLSKGQVDAHEATDAILSAIQAKSGGPLGTAGEKFGAGQISVQIQRIKDQIGGLFEHMDTGPLVKILGKIGESLEGEGGKKIGALLQKAFSGISEWLTKITNGGDVSGLIDKIAAAFQWCIEAVQTASKWVGEFFKWCSDNSGTLEAIGVVLLVIVGAFVLVAAVISVVVVALAAVAAAFVGFVAFSGYAIGQLAYGIYDGVTKAWHWLSDFAGKVYDVGASIVDGLWNGIKGAWAGMLSGFHALVELLPAGVKKVLGIASPSRVFAGLGLNVGLGMSAGLSAGMGGIHEQIGRMNRATLGIGGGFSRAMGMGVGFGTHAAMGVHEGIGNMGRATLGHVGASMHGLGERMGRTDRLGGGGGNISITVEKVEGKNAEEIGENLRKIVLPELASAFEQLSHEAGG